MSVSLDPPLIGFLPGKSSRSWPAIAQSGAFCVNILAAGQDEMCWRFAKEPAEGDDNKFVGVDWTPSTTSCPILPGVIGWIDCTVEGVSEAGDHWFVLGRVVDMAHGVDVENAMVFFRGKVTSVAKP